MRDDELLEHYASIERRYSLIGNPAYGSLVGTNGNAQAPVHRWFHLKEGFSHRLFNTVLDEVGLAGQSQLRIIDPFTGSGTTLLSALEYGAAAAPRDIVAVGVERNPFLAFVSRTKLTAARSQVQALSSDLLNWGEAILELLDRTSKGRRAPRPALSTFRNTDYFRPSAMRQLILLRNLIDETASDTVTRSLGRLALAASIEPTSYLRRDGRAMRYAPEKSPLMVADAFLHRIKVMSIDLAQTEMIGRAQVAEGDGRTPPDSYASSTPYDLALFSPPYPNNIDYTEVYKLEAWLLGFFTNKDEFLAQRHRTLRSHPSVVFDVQSYADQRNLGAPFAELLAPLLGALPDDRFKAQRQRTFSGYCDDLLKTLCSLRPLMRTGAPVVIVVGNSLHGSASGHVVMAADLLIARLAEFAGYHVERLIEARRPRRRAADEPYLRESLVILRTPLM